MQAAPNRPPPRGKPANSWPRSVSRERKARMQAYPKLVNPRKEAE